jgi:hypothetical protein
VGTAPEKVIVAPGAVVFAFGWFVKLGETRLLQVLISDERKPAAVAFLEPMHELQTGPSVSM